MTPLIQLGEFIEVEKFSLYLESLVEETCPPSKLGFLPKDIERVRVRLFAQHSLSPPLQRRAESHGLDVMEASSLTFNKFQSTIRLLRSDSLTSLDEYKRNWISYVKSGSELCIDALGALAHLAELAG